MSKSTLYIVRGGTHKGKYISLRVRQPELGKYAWANTKDQAVCLSYNQARGVVRRYGGEIVTA